MDAPPEKVEKRRPPHAWRYSLPALGLAAASLGLAYAAHPASCDPPTSLSHAAGIVSTFALCAAAVAAMVQVVVLAAVPGARLSAAVGLGLTGATVLVVIWAEFIASPLCFEFG